MNRRFFFAMANKALLLFTIFNVVYLVLQPLSNSSLTLYNRLFPGRLRIVWTDRTGDYLVNETLLPRLLGDHVVARPKAENEHRVVVLGSSETWGFHNLPEETMPVVLDHMNLHTPDGRQVRVYNLASIRADAFKDLLILSTALDMGVRPDLILLNTNIASYATRYQAHWLSEANADLALFLIERYHIESVPLEPLLTQVNSAPNWWRHSFIAQRHDIAAWLTNQVYGFAWAALAEDYPLEGNIQEGVTPRQPFDAPLTRADVLDAIALLAEEQGIPLLMVETPVNFIYSDAYTTWLEERTSALDIPRLDCSKLLPPNEFTSTSLHFSAAGHRAVAEQVSIWLEQHWEHFSSVTYCPDNTEE
jgi:hypothetical protein